MPLVGDPLRCLTRKREISFTIMVIAISGAVMLWGYMSQTIYENTNRFSVENTHTWDLRIEYWNAEASLDGH